MGNMVHIYHADRMERATSQSAKGTLTQRWLAYEVIRRLRTASREGLVDIPWDEWDAYCAVLDNRTAGA